METQIFSDGIGRITVIGGVVRLDLVTYSPTEADAQGRPRQVFSQRIVMGTEAFLHSSEKIAEMVQQLARAAQVQQAGMPQAATPAPRPPAPRPPAPAAMTHEPIAAGGPSLPDDTGEPPPPPFP